MALGIQECREHIEKFLAVSDFDLDKALSRGFLSVNLILTRSCNLSCPYCYQSVNFKATADQMTLETAERSIAFVYTSHPNVKDITVALFGGEPYTRFDLVKHLVEKYPQIKFSITTNGVLLIEEPSYLEWTLKQTNLFVSLSINALKFKYGLQFIEQAQVLMPLLTSPRAEVHYVVDDPNEVGVFDNVVSLIDSKVRSLRINLPKESSKLFTEKEAFLTLFKRIADLVYVEGKRPARFGWDVGLESNAARLAKGEEIKARSSSYCGAGWSYIAIDTNGDIYPCDYFIQFPERKIGDVFKGYYTKDKMFDGMKGWHKEVFKGCDDCQFGDVRHCTNAMCYAENLKVTGDMFVPTKETCALRAIEFGIYSYIATITKGKDLAIDETPPVC